MTDLEQHIKRITEKLHFILKNYSHLQRENEKLKNELLSVKSREAEKDDLLKLMGLRTEVLKASKGTMSDDEKRIFEKTINQYLKEIDKCIALLNE